MDGAETWEQVNNMPLQAINFWNDTLGWAIDVWNDGTFPEGSTWKIAYIKQLMAV